MVGIVKEVENGMSSEGNIKYNLELEKSYEKED